MKYKFTSQQVIDALALGEYQSVIGIGGFSTLPAVYPDGKDAYNSGYEIDSVYHSISDKSSSISKCLDVVKLSKTINGLPIGAEIEIPYYKGKKFLGRTWLKKITNNSFTERHEYKMSKKNSLIGNLYFSRSYNKLCYVVYYGNDVPNHQYLPNVIIEGANDTGYNWVMLQICNKNVYIVIKEKRLLKSTKYRLIAKGVED